MSVMPDYSYICGKEFVIISDRFYLRRLCVDDATIEYLRWLNDSTVNRFLDTKKIDIFSLEQYVCDKSFKTDCLLFGIFIKGTKVHIGNVKLEPIENSVATVGLLIGNKKYWNKGFATDVLICIVDFCFNILDLNMVKLGVKKDNKSAIRVYEKAGFCIYDKTEDCFKMNIYKTKEMKKENE